MHPPPPGERPRRPAGPATDSPARRARDAERLFDAPDRRDVTEANKAMREEVAKPRPPLLPGETAVPPD